MSKLYRDSAAGGAAFLIAVESNYSAEAHAMMDNRHEGQYLGAPVGICNRAR